MVRFIILFITLLTTSHARASEAPAQDPAWLTRMETGPRHLQDPIGKQLVRRANTGIALMPVGLVLQGGGVLLGAGLRGTHPELWATTFVAGEGLLIGAGIGSTISLNRAATHLSRDGVHLSRTPLVVSSVLLATGGVSLVTGSTLFLYDTESQGLALYCAGLAALLGAMVPLSIQSGRTRRAYLELDEQRVPAVSVNLAPWLDPNTPGATVTFHL